MVVLHFLCGPITRHFFKHYALSWRMDGPKKFSRLSMRKCRLCHKVNELVVEISSEPPGHGWKVVTQPPPSSPTSNV